MAEQQGRRARNMAMDVVSSMCFVAGGIIIGWLIWASPWATDTTTSTTPTTITAPKATSTTSTTRPAGGGAVTTATVGSDPYGTYQEIARSLAGDTNLSRTDAATRASLLCAHAADYLIAGPLADYPTDLALVRAYCPDIESTYK